MLEPFQLFWEGKELFSTDILIIINLSNNYTTWPYWAPCFLQSVIWCDLELYFYTCWNCIFTNARLLYSAFHLQSYNSTQWQNPWNLTILTYGYSSRQSGNWFLIDPRIEMMRGTNKGFLFCLLKQLSWFYSYDRCIVASSWLQKVTRLRWEKKWAVKTNLCKSEWTKNILQKHYW